MSDRTDQSSTSGSGTSDDPRDIRCAELEQWLTDGRPCTILDVRTEEEWNARRIPGATLVPLHELEARLDEVLDLPGPLVVHCEHGVRSVNAAYFLAARGRRDVFNVTEGLCAWRGPVESGGPAGSRVHRGGPQK